jgi:DNA-binding response OmpR family regulator
MEETIMPAIVLIVDSHRETVSLLEKALTQEGFQVISSDSGQAALARASQEKPDLILVDWGLPDMDAYEFMRLHHRSVPTPIIILAAAAGTETRVRSLEVGADDFVVRPVSPRELALRIRAVLRRSGIVDNPFCPDPGILPASQLRTSIALA